MGGGRIAVVDDSGPIVVLRKSLYLPEPTGGAVVVGPCRYPFRNQRTDCLEAPVDAAGSFDLFAVGCGSKVFFSVDQPDPGRCLSGGGKSGECSGWARIGYVYLSGPMDVEDARMVIRKWLEYLNHGLLYGFVDVGLKSRRTGKVVFHEVSVCSCELHLNPVVQRLVDQCSISWERERRGREKGRGMGRVAKTQRVKKVKKQVK